MDNKNHIPVIDFSCFKEGDSSEIDILDKNVQETSKKICDAFRDIGFVYIKNHGVGDKEVDPVRSIFETFFSLPLDIKRKYLRQGYENNGYVAVEMENLNPARPHGDLKEAFNTTPKTMKLWPNADVPGFEDKVNNFFNKATLLGHRVLQCMAIGLNLKDPHFLRDCHHIQDLDVANTTALRVVRYPPVDGIEVKPGQIRCGEHSDYGSITLVFQDNMGGLEVQGPDGEYHPATPVPGTVIVNLGDLMQQWTADKLKATKHRVVIPEAEAGRKQARMSLVYFMQPDNDCVIECLDGSNKYPAVTSYQWLISRFAQTY